MTLMFWALVLCFCTIVLCAIVGVGFVIFCILYAAYMTLFRRS
jgi:hypothetical protein